MFDTKRLAAFSVRISRAPCQAGASIPKAACARARAGERADFQSHRARSHAPLARSTTRPALSTGKHQRRRPGRQRAQERDRDAEDEQQAEATHHRHRREHQHKQAADAREHGRGDRGHAVRGGFAHRLERVGGALGTGLLDARLELDRVVNRQADEHRQHSNRGHRQRSARERERTECERRGEQRDRKRQKARAPLEDQAEDKTHHQQHGDQQQLDRMRDRAA